MGEGNQGTQYMDNYDILLLLYVLISVHVSVLVFVSPIDIACI